MAYGQGTYSTTEYAGIYIPLPIVIVTLTAVSAATGTVTAQDQRTGGPT